MFDNRKEIFEILKKELEGKINAVLASYEGQTIDEPLEKKMSEHLDRDINAWYEEKFYFFKDQRNWVGALILKDIMEQLEAKS